MMKRQLCNAAWLMALGTILTMPSEAAWRYNAKRASTRNRVVEQASVARRGGDTDIYELNPNFVPSNRQQGSVPMMSLSTAPTLGDLERSPYQPRQEKQQYINSDDMSFRIQQSSTSPIQRLQQHMALIHQISPTISVVSYVCVAIFFMWQIPVFQKGRMLPHYFVCSRRNVIRRRVYSSMILSALSHASLTHLLFNLVAYISLGPTVKQALRGWQLWPFVIGASVSGSLMYLLATRGGGGCMGLSGVTLALLALFARMYPQREIGLALFGILPVRLPAELALYGILAWSSVGTLILPNSRVAHSAHLGGILFGILYHEIWKQRMYLRRVRHKLWRSS